MKDNCCCEVSTSNAGVDQVLANCITSTVLDGNLPTIGCGRWTFISGEGTIKNPKKYNSKVSDLGDGDNVLQWRISLDCKECPCAEESTDTVTITTSCT